MRRGLSIASPDDRRVIGERARRPRSDELNWPASLHLVGQQRRGAALLPTVFQQSRTAAGGIGGNRAQEPLELVRARAVELAVGAARQLGDLGKHARSRAVAALLEREHRQAEQTELARL